MCVWVLEESVEELKVIAGPIPVLVPSLSSSGEPDAIVVADAPAGECHVGGRRRGRDDCWFGGSVRAADLRDPGDEPLPGMKV